MTTATELGYYGSMKTTAMDAANEFVASYWAEPRKIRSVASKSWDVIQFDVVGGSAIYTCKYDPEKRHWVVSR